MTTSIDEDGNIWTDEGAPHGGFRKVKPEELHRPFWLTSPWGEIIVVVLWLLLMAGLILDKSPDNYHPDNDHPGYDYRIW